MVSIQVTFFIFYLLIQLKLNIFYLRKKILSQEKNQSFKIYVKSHLNNMHSNVFILSYVFECVTLGDTSILRRFYIKTKISIFSLYRKVIYLNTKTESLNKNRTFQDLEHLVRKLYIANLFNNIYIFCQFCQRRIFHYGHRRQSRIIIIVTNSCFIMYR